MMILARWSFDMKAKVFLILILLWILTGCSGYSERELREIASQAALGTPPPEALQTAASIHLQVTMTPTPTITPIPGTPTMGVQEWLATQAAEERFVSMTQQANDLAFEREKIAATEQAVAAVETQRAVEEQQKIVYANQTAQAEATQDYATAFAAATATESAHIMLAAQGTAAAVATESVAPTHAMWTATAISIQIRINEGQARGVELATERQEAKNLADALLPWALVIVVFAVLANAITKYVRVRPFKRDEFGREQTLYIQNGPVTQVLKPELMTGPVMRLRDDGVVDLPVVSDPAEQADTTRRAQLVEAIAALPDTHAPQAPKMLSGEYSGKSPSRIRVRGDQALGGVMQEVDGLLVEEDK
jgi:hypothetical protein